MITAYGLAGRDISYVVNQDYETVAREVILYSPRVSETVTVGNLDTAVDRFGFDSDEYSFCRSYWEHNNGSLKVCPVSEMDDWVASEIGLLREAEYYGGEL